MINQVSLDEILMVQGANALTRAVGDMGVDDLTLALSTLTFSKFIGRVPMFNFEKYPVSNIFVIAFVQQLMKNMMHDLWQDAPTLGDVWGGVKGQLGGAKQTN